MIAEVQRQVLPYQLNYLRHGDLLRPALRSLHDTWSEVSRPAPGGRTVGREDSTVVTCCAHLGHGGIIMGVVVVVPGKTLVL